MNNDASFGCWLKERRVALDFTQAELAQQIGCAEVTLRKLEANVRRPSKQMAVRLAEVLNVGSSDQLDFVRFARGEETVTGAARAAPVAAGRARWSTPHPSTNLPTQPTPLLGRGHELAALRRRILHDGQRLVTFLGPPGVGKTRLAMEAASGLAEHFADGVFWVPLAPLRDPAIVPPVVCQALGLQESGLPATERLKHYLNDKHMLLVLDNFEHLLPAAPVVAELLGACPWLHFLVTSRAPLRVRAERQFPVPPLALPDLAQLPASPDRVAMLDYAAIALFVDRAQAVQPAFDLTAENAGTVATLCTQVDGLPLAIELVAARVKALPPPALVARLRGRLLLSSDGLRDVESRHQTLRQAIGWSYELLAPAEQTLLARLGVFLGGCTLEMADAVCGAASDPARSLDMVDGLVSLVDKNLVVQRTGEEGEPRFVLLETIRDFALERLAASGEEQAVRRRHAEVCLQLAEEAEPHLRSVEQLVWFSRLEAEHANLRAALGWCAEEEGESLLGLRLANALGWFWYVRAHYSEGSRWLDVLLVLAGETVPAPLRAWTLYHISLQAVGLDDFRLGRVMGEAALALARTLDDQRLIGHSCQVLSVHICCQGEYDHAELLRGEALAIARAAGDQWLEMRILLTRLYYPDYADSVGAISWAIEAVPLVRRTGDRTLTSSWLKELACAMLLGQEPWQAAPLLEESLHLSQQLGNKRMMAECLYKLGVLAFAQGNHEQAAAYYQEMMALGRQDGSPGYVAFGLLHLGILAQVQGRPSDALARYQEGLMAVKELRHNMFVGTCLTVMATLADAPAPPLNAVQATQLLGATAALQGLDRVYLDVDCAAQCRRLIDATYARLADPTHAAAWAEGQAMSLDEAIQYALACGGLESKSRLIEGEMSWARR
jgi:predicted ATPase/transcriptional regulator with XRE-family HTH domain